MKYTIFLEVELGCVSLLMLAIIVPSSVGSDTYGSYGCFAKDKLTVLRDILLKLKLQIGLSWLKLK